MSSSALQTCHQNCVSGLWSLWRQRGHVWVKRPNPSPGTAPKVLVEKGAKALWGQGNVVLIIQNFQQVDPPAFHTPTRVIPVVIDHPLRSGSPSGIPRLWLFSDPAFAASSHPQVSPPCWLWPPWARWPGTHCPGSPTWRLWTSSSPSASSLSSRPWSSTPCSTTTPTACAGLLLRHGEWYV